MRKLALMIMLFAFGMSANASDLIDKDVKSISTIKFLKNSLKLTNHEWLSFNVNMIALKDGKSWYNREYEVILHYDKKNPLVFVCHKDKFTDNIFLMDKNKVTIIDKFTNEFTIYDDGKKKYGMYSFYGTLDYLKKYFAGLGYYIVPMSSKINGYQYTTPPIKYYKDTVLDNIPYKKYTGFTPEVYTKAVSETGEKYEYESYDRIDNYINDENFLLDSVYWITYYTNSYDNSKDEKKIKIGNYNFDNRQNYIDSIFNINNPEYAKFSRHNQDNIPMSRRLSKNEIINDSILNFPLVSLDYDTTYLNEKSSWMLLNLWVHNCAPCIENLQKYKREIDSLGYRILENNGIEILAINYQTDNMKLINNMADKTNSTDIMYSAKGLGNSIRIPSLGYYYLISPDKKVVFKDYKLGDYSELLKAKEEYEKKNK